MPTPFRLGVNYWPRTTAMYWWREFDPAEVADDFARIADLGLDLVRIFLLWDDWQPTSETVDPACLAHLHTVADLAHQHGLQLNVTFFTGHMSGPNWAPAWLRDPYVSSATPYPRPVVTGGTVQSGHYRNPFTDPEALSAAELLLQTVILALRHHPAIAIWNLGNEPDLFAWPPSDDAGQAWVQRMTDLVRLFDPDHPVTIGLHTDSLLLNNHLRVDQVFTHTDFATMHAYPMYQPWLRDPLDPDYVPFTVALTHALSGKPVLAEEWGGPTAPPGSTGGLWSWQANGLSFNQFMPSENQLADYVAAVLPRLVAVGATGALLWCWADYPTPLNHRPPCDTFWHERHFGLIRADGTLKPHADVLRRFAATRPTVNPTPKSRLPTLDPAAYYAAPATEMYRLYKHYLASD